MFYYNRAAFFEWDELGNKFEDWSVDYFGHSGIFVKPVREEYEYWKITLSNLRESDQEKFQQLREQYELSYEQDGFDMDNDFPGNGDEISLYQKISEGILSSVAGFQIKESIANEYGIYVFGQAREDGIDIYTHDEASKIVELFEQVLDKNDIYVPSPEDDERDLNHNDAKLYGSVYSELFDQIEKQLIMLLDHHKNHAKVITYRYSGTC